MKIRTKNLFWGINDISLCQNKEQNFAFDEFKQKGPVTVTGKADRYEGAIYMKLNINTPASFVCHRCAEEYDISLKTTANVTLGWKEKKTWQGEDDFFQFINEEQEEIDLTEIVRESIVLSLPIKSLCNENCKGLCFECGKNLNKENCNCNTEKN